MCIRILLIRTHVTASYDVVMWFGNVIVYISAWASSCLSFREGKFEGLVREMSDKTLTLFLCNINITNDHTTMTLEQIIDTFDDFVRDYHDIEHPFNEMFYEMMGNNLCYCATPEPYLGDPYKSLAVIININPGCVHRKNLVTGTYSEWAKSFPYLHDSENKDGNKFWESRMPWMRHIAEQFTGEKLDELMPFALELCPWHSTSWRNKQITDAVKDEYVKKYVLAMALLAVKNSRAKVILAVGKPVYDALSECGCDPMKEWDEYKEEFNIGSNVRKYEMLEYQGIPILCTWAQGGNKTPSNEFKGMENEIIKEFCMPK